MGFNYKAILNEIVRNNPQFHDISDEERKKLQQALFKMACDIDEKCKNVGIKLFLVGGSLLGAVRHGGFIPWDDDMDFALSREDYNRLKDNFDKILGDIYELRCPNSKYPNGNRFMQIYKKNTVLKTIGEGNPIQPDSIYIDVFPYDYVPNNKVIRVVKGCFANLYMGIASCVMDYVYPDKLIQKYMRLSKDGARLLRIKKIIGFVCSYRSPEKWFDKVDKIVTGKKKTKYVTSATGRKHYFGEIYQTDVFFPLQEVKFNDYCFFAPRKYKKYLQGLYGDNYMVLPNANARESHFISELKIDL